MRLQAENIIITNGCMGGIATGIARGDQAGRRGGLESPTYFNLLPLFASLA
jgi:DNA-binding transcriptional MocR family regulator